MRVGNTAFVAVFAESIGAVRDLERSKMDGLNVIISSLGGVSGFSASGRITAMRQI